MDFYGVGFDPTQPIDELEAYKVSNGFVYQTAVPVSRVLPDLRITGHSTKIAMNGSGIITYKAGKGTAPSDWSTLFAKLATGQ